MTLHDNEFYDDTSANYIDDQTKNRLKKHNLKLSMAKSIGVINPRHEAKTTWVGVDIIIPESAYPKNEMKYERFSKLLTMYFDTTNQDINDFYYWGVKEDENNNFSLTCVDAECTEQSRGIIFISKQFIRENTYSDSISLHQFPNLDSALADKALKTVKKEVAAYASWTKSDIYDFTVSTRDNNEHAGDSHCYGIGDVINNSVNECIDGVVEDIDSNKNSMALILNICTIELDEDTDPIEYVVSYLESFFDTRLTLGTTYFDEEASEACVVFLPSELPSFQKVIDHVGHYFIDSMVDYTTNDKKFEKLETWDVVRMLSGTIPFEKWPTVMQNTFLNALFNSIADVTFKSAQWRYLDMPA